MSMGPNLCLILTKFVRIRQRIIQLSHDWKVIEKVSLYHQYYHYYHCCTMAVRLNMTLIPPRRLYACFCAYMSSSLCLFVFLCFCCSVCITNMKKRKKRKKERKEAPTCFLEFGLLPNYLWCRFKKKKKKKIPFPVSAENKCRLHFERWGGKCAAPVRLCRCTSLHRKKNKHPTNIHNKQHGEKNRSGPEVGLNALNQTTALTKPASHLATWARCAAGVR